MRRKIAIATVTTAALIGTGGAVAVAQDDGPTPSPSASSSQQDDTREKPTAAEAAGIAQKTASGTVTSIELDDDNQGPVWDVDLTQGSTSREIRLDAETGKVFINQEEDAEDSVPADLKISAADAARKAAAKGTVTSVDIDDDVNNAWEVETTDGNGKVQELRVDGQTGEVTQRQPHDDRDDQGDRHEDGDRDDHGDRHDDLDDDGDRDDHGGRHGGDDDRDDRGDRDDHGGRHGGHGRH